MTRDERAGQVLQEAFELGLIDAPKLVGMRGHSNPRTDHALTVQGMLLLLREALNDDTLYAESLLMPFHVDDGVAQGWADTGKRTAEDDLGIMVRWRLSRKMETRDIMGRRMMAEVFAPSEADLYVKCFELLNRTDDAN